MNIMTHKGYLARIDYSDQDELFTGRISGVQYHQGKYLLYYSVSGFGKNASGIGVTSSPTLNPSAPGYHWQDHGMMLQSIPGRDLWNAIDPNIVEDNQGQGWINSYTSRLLTEHER